MPSKQKVILVLRLTALTLFCAIAVAYFYLPTYSESILLPKIAKSMGIDISCHVRRIGFAGADFDSLRIGFGNIPILSADSIRTDFSPLGLFNKHINKITITGVELRCVFKNGQLMIPGYDPKNKPESDNRKKSSDTSEIPSVDLIEINNLTISYESEGKKFGFPVSSVSIVPLRDWKTLLSNVELAPWADKISLLSDFDNNRIVLKANAKTIHLEKLFRLADKPPFPVLSGEAGIDAHAVIVPEPFGISMSSFIGFSKLKVIHDNLNITSEFPEIRISGNGTLAKGMELKIKTSKTDFEVNSANIRIPSLSLEGKLKQNKTLQFKGFVNFANAEYKDKFLHIKGITGSIPSNLPPTGEKGKVSVSSVRWKDTDFGSLAISLRQTETGMVFDGKNQSNILPNLIIALNGKTETSSDGSKTGIRLSTAYKFSSYDVDKVLPSAAGMTVSGDIEVNNEWNFEKQGISSVLSADVRNGSIVRKKTKMAIEGIALKFSMPDLMRLRSNLSQQITFEKAGFGNILLKKGKILFQMESPRSFLIERADFEWCDGHVSANSLHISSEDDDYETILYCDRLKLAMLLEQLDIAKAEGGGTVNGKIPLTFKDGKFGFHDGFLFSTPGDAGSVRIGGMDNLDSGIPRNSKEYSQIELAKEALRNYNYNWIKLKLTTEGENLMLRLQFDGKPANPLPFVYDKESGGFSKSGSEKDVSNFEGIGIDVNLKIPLEKILHYKDIIKIIKKKKR